MEGNTQIPEKIFLRRIYEEHVIPVRETKGTEKFADGGVFDEVSGVKLPDSEAKPTSATQAAVWDMGTGKFTEIFGALGNNRKFWTESQVVAFCIDNRERLLKGGHAGFFELEGGLVAYVHSKGGKLLVTVYELSLDFTWSSEDQNRLVSLV